MAKFVITTVSTFVNRYAIEADSAPLAEEEWEKLDQGVYEDLDPTYCLISQVFCDEEVKNITEATDSELIESADDYMRDNMRENLHLYVRRAPS